MIDRRHGASAPDELRTIDANAAQCDFKAPLRHSIAYFEALAALLANVPHDAFNQAVDALLAARADGRRVYIIGNGGSAATASHLACDLMKSAHVPPHAPLRAIALGDNRAVITAIANDESYARVFSRQIEALAEPNDVLIAISASGRSNNIIYGLDAAEKRKLQTIGLLGFDGGDAREMVDIPLHIVCDDYGLVEDVHSAIGHALTAAVRKSLQD